MERIKSYCQKLTEISFYLLFFLVPLIFSPNNYELFEYNKMMLTYALTALIISLWLIVMAINKKIEIRHTPFDKFLLFFLLSQILSTIFSIDVHVSIFGYYSRFHQGLLATISYIILYYALTTNFPKEKIKNLLYSSFVSAFIVSIWGIFEHAGHSFSCLLITKEFNVDCWIQDVQTRVFATLGQPNWMSAYLAILIPVAIGLAFISSKTIVTKSKKIIENYSLTTNSIIFAVFTLIFYMAFLFTRSRSGFIALWAGLAVLGLILFKKRTKTLFLIIVILLTSTFIFGSGISQIDKFTLPSFSKTPTPQTPTSGTAMETGGTESGAIRAIVWKGALDVMLHYPIFGSGVETFAFSYYQYRPESHNMVSEWDFLYNKAHNEYLNFAATGGIVGLIAYLGFIAGFVFWIILRLKNNSLSLLSFSLFSGWLTILITNFFGFSVVIIALYFYLIPAIVFINEETKVTSHNKTINNLEKAILGILAIILTVFLFTRLYNFYQADIDYAKGLSYSKSGNIKEAYLLLTEAIEKNPMEPIYHDEISNVLANIAVSFANDKDEESAKKFASLALKESDIATSISPNNVTFYKTSAKINYTLSVLDPSFLARAVSSLEKASILSPTDPKLLYNLAIIQSKMNNLPTGVKILEKAVLLKPNYRDARFALALLYKDSGEPQKAITELKYILTNINPEDQEAKDKLNSYD